MNFNIGSKVKITATDHFGKTGKIIDIDYEVIKDENNPDFDWECGEYMVMFSNSLQCEWFWESELKNV